jgi:acetyltransferase-like isoleucine patch superfamily enzyme
VRHQNGQRDLVNERYLQKVESTELPNSASRLQNGRPAVSEDFILRGLPRLASKVHSLWLKTMYPFAAFGEGVSIPGSCQISRSMASEISVGDDVTLGRDVWLNVAPGSESSEAKIVLGSGCEIGRRSTISARNRIFLEADVLLAPSVLIMDHSHEFSDVEIPIRHQGVTRGGRIFIQRNCWLGHGAVIVCNHGELTIGRNSVVGANAVVTRSFPAFSVIAGNPAILIRTYDRQTGTWMKSEAACKQR